MVKSLKKFLILNPSDFALRRAFEGKGKLLCAKNEV
jgi:hypothetical protein